MIFNLSQRLVHLLNRAVWLAVAEERSVVMHHVNCLLPTHMPIATVFLYVNLKTRSRSSHSKMLHSKHIHTHRRKRGEKGCLFKQWRQRFVYERQMNRGIVCIHYIIVVIFDCCRPALMHNVNIQSIYKFVETNFITSTVWPSKVDDDDVDDDDGARTYIFRFICF